MQTITAKKHYTFAQAYRVLYDGMRTVRYLSRARKLKLMTDPFMERIMLAVTEVNGCAICSYYHSKVALESGLSDQEVQQMLAGETTDLPAHEAPAVAFAQHYADSMGEPTRKAWQRVNEIYGETGSLGILGAIRMIMIGNVYGIAWSALINRLKGKPDPNSSLLYELGILFSMVFFFPVVLIHLVWSALQKDPLINFSE